MRKIIHRIIASFLLLACVFSGVNASYALAAEKHEEHACGEEHHSHSHAADAGHEHPEGQPNDEHSHCPCVGCHLGCAHNAFIVEPVAVPALESRSVELIISDSVAALLTRAAEIFIPPKLTA